MKTPRAYALTVAALYAVVAAGWILVSGIVVGALPAVVARQLEIGKGLAFVAVTSVALYFVVARWTTRFVTEQRNAAGAQRILGQVVDTVPIGVLLTGDEGEITFLNPAAIDLLGTSAVDSIGRKLEELCSADGGRGVVDFGELLRTGAVDGLEVCGKPGEAPRAVIARAAQVDPSLPGSGWVVALADTTEAYRAGERSRKMMRGYRFVSDVAVLINRAHSADQMLQAACDLAVARGGYQGAWATALDAETGETRVVAMIGLGDRVKDIIRVMTKRWSESQSPAMIAQLEQQDLIIHNDLAHDPANPYSADAATEGFGSSVALSVTGSGMPMATVTLYAAEPGYFDADQGLLLSSLRNDIAYGLEKLALDAKRLSAEEALEHSERNYRQLFESNPQPMWVYDRETLRFLAVNSAAMRKYGFTAEQFADMSIRDIRPAEDVERLIESLAHKPGGLDDAGFWTHRDASGREFTVQIHSHTLEWAGRPAELVLPTEIARLDT